MNTRSKRYAMMRSFARTAGALALLLAFRGAAFSAASNESALDTRLGDFKASSGRELVTLCKDTLKKPCGLEEAPGESIQQSKGLAPLHLSSASAREALDAIAARHPGYQWTSRGGVVDFEPKKLEDDILSKKLDKVSLHGVSSFQAARRVLDQAKIPFAYQPKGGRYATIDIDLTDVTVRDALNAIVTADGQVMWVFSHSPKSGGPKFTGTLTMPSWRTEGVGPHGEGTKNEKKQ